MKKVMAKKKVTLSSLTIQNRTTLIDYRSPLIKLHMSFSVIIV